MRFALYLAAGAARAWHNCNVYLGAELSEALRRRFGRACGRSVDSGILLIKISDYYTDSKRARNAYKTQKKEREGRGEREVKG